MTDAPDICIHHHPCADGFTSAWAVWKKWGDAVQFHPGVYGEAPPDVADKDVLLVDFSYKRPVLDKMVEQCRSLTILDHHKSAQADLEGWDARAHPNVDVVFDMDRSGAVLAWDYCHDSEAPPICLYVQDRDLWRFQLHGSREVAAVLFSHSYEFGAWDDLAAQLSTRAGLENIISQGVAIERKHHKDVRELLAQTTRSMVIGGYPVRVANLPYTMSSDAAHELAKGYPFGACYFDRADGARVFSLRSMDDGADVSVIAAAYGGGGHAHASGFQAPLGWEGDPR